MMGGVVVSVVLSPSCHAMPLVSKLSCHAPGNEAPMVGSTSAGIKLLEAMEAAVGPQPLGCGTLVSGRVQ